MKVNIILTPLSQVQMIWLKFTLLTSLQINKSSESAEIMHGHVDRWHKYLPDHEYAAWRRFMKFMKIYHFQYIRRSIFTLKI